MVQSIHHHIIRTLQRLADHFSGMRKRDSASQSGPLEPNKSTLKTQAIRPLIFLILSIVLGLVLAHKIETRGAKEWAQTHGPSEKILRMILNDLGFQPLTHWTKQANLQSQISKKEIHFQKNFWSSSDHNTLWIPNAGMDSKTEPGQFWTRAQSEAQTQFDWINWGRGYEAFHFLQKLEKIPHLSPQAKKQPSYIDPKQIHY